MFKLVRLGRMLSVELTEVRGMQLDEDAVDALAQAQERVVAELASAVPADLIDELGRVRLRRSLRRPTSTELRIMQAQIIGWLEGLLHGVQIAISVQGADGGSAPAAPEGPDRVIGHYL